MHYASCTPSQLLTPNSQLIKHPHPVSLSDEKSSSPTLHQHLRQQPAHRHTPPSFTQSPDPAVYLRPHRLPFSSPLQPSTVERQMSVSVVIAYVEVRGASLDCASHGISHRQPFPSRLSYHSPHSAFEVRVSCLSEFFLCHFLWFLIYISWFFCCKITISIVVLPSHHL